jgi:hypothetical protein
MMKGLKNRFQTFLVLKSLFPLMGTVLLKMIDDWAPFLLHYPVIISINSKNSNAVVSQEIRYMYEYMN